MKFLVMKKNVASLINTEKKDLKEATKVEAEVSVIPSTYFHSNYYKIILIHNFTRFGFGGGGGGNRQQEQRRGPNIEIPLEVTLKDIYLGKEIRVIFFPPKFSKLFS
jgi:DnaJ-class molecular chaperone